ncbi:hypothetical protein DLJ47_01890 [Micromonospora sp. S4605]|nr:hypothetical protein DLJ47_01890 [Micromonospora sp. S4605]
MRWRTDDERGKSFSYRWRPHPSAPWIKEKPKTDTAGFEADHYLWQLRAVRRAVRAGEPVWWPEGERDALELGRAGVVATSHHGGACKVSPEQCAWLRGAAGVVLLADRDAAGAACALRRYEGLLEHAGLRPWQVRVLRAATGKDAADHLAAGYGLADFVPVSLTTLRRKAAEYTPETAAAAGYMYVGLTVIVGGRRITL